MPWPAALYNRRKLQLIGKSQWCCSTYCGHSLHTLTYNWTRGMQLANTPPLQSTTLGLHPVSFHQMAPAMRGNTHPITAYYSVYRPRKDERLSGPSGTSRIVVMVVFYVVFSKWRNEIVFVWLNTLSMLPKNVSTLATLTRWWQLLVSCLDSHDMVYIVY